MNNPNEDRRWTQEDIDEYLRSRTTLPILGAYGEDKFSNLYALAKSLSNEYITIKDMSYDPETETIYYTAEPTKEVEYIETKWVVPEDEADEFIETLDEVVSEVLDS